MGVRRSKSRIKGFSQGCLDGASQTALLPSQPLARPEERTVQAPEVEPGRNPDRTRTGSPSTLDQTPSPRDPTFLTERWGPSLAHGDPGITIPPDWRSTVARWPHTRWSTWRKRSAELAEALAATEDPDGPPSPEERAELIRRAEHRAFLELEAPTP